MNTLHKLTKMLPRRVVKHQINPVKLASAPFRLKEDGWSIIHQSIRKKGVHTNRHIDIYCETTSKETIELSPWGFLKITLYDVGLWEEGGSQL